MSYSVQNIIRALLFTLATLVANFTYSQQATEYQVKAAYLFNFTKFVEWPADAFANNNEPFVVGILGPDPFGHHLTEIIAGESAFSRPIAIRYFNHPGEVGLCHILYINLPEKSVDILKEMSGKPVLTISDDAGFCERGGAIRFFLENEMIRLEINQKAAQAADLKISSKLLRIARLCK